MKKIISTALAVLILCVQFALIIPFAQAEILRDKVTATLQAAEQVFPDVPKTHINFNAVAFLTEREIIKGYDDGTFKPDNMVNRAELVKMVAGMMMGEPSSEDIAKYKNCFPDVGTEWFAPYVCLAKEKGWVQGYPDGSFKPANSVNRVEAIKIVLGAMIQSDYWPNPTDAEKALPMPVDSDPNAWYAGYLKFAIVKELLDGQHVTGNETAFYYKPGEPMTRKEVAEMIFRINLYMAERLEYADIISQAACVELLNTGLSEEQAKQKWIDEVLTPAGYTEADADNLAAKYIEDDVASELINDNVQVKCGDPLKANMTKWEGFTMYGA